jgi:hypothetical protein
MPCVCFEDTNYSLTVRKYNGTEWEVVGSRCFTPVNILQSTLYVNGNDIYVCYINNNGYVYARKFDGANWNLIGPEAFSTYQAMFGLGFTLQAGVPYVSYISGCGFIVMKFDGTNWNNLGSTCFTGSTEYAQLAFDNGTPYVAYGGWESVFVKAFNGNDWANFDSAGLANEDGCSGFYSVYFNIFNGVKYVFFENACSDVFHILSNAGSGWAALNNAGLRNYPAFYIGNNGTLEVFFEDNNSGGLGTVLYYGY